MQRIAVIVLLALATTAHAQLIPYPASVNPATGQFTITRRTGVVADPAFVSEASYLKSYLGRYLGAAPTGRGISLQKDASITNPEGYHLTITPQQITITASGSAGIFYGIQTLRQLLPAKIENGSGPTIAAPATDITDAPVFPWRGMMLDVSRHFFSVTYVKHYIDMMAMYKLNHLHLHLTDDQGWRIEIKHYPRLTQKSAWRTFNDQDSACMQLEKETGNPDFRIDPAHVRVVNGRTEYGGFFTQAQIKDIIDYAAKRHVEVVPEIDMPGHMMAAILQYPELMCEEKPASDWRHGFSTPICPCKDTVLEFAKNVFGELADLFPSKYIHIGGDEVEKSEWKKSPLVARFMEEHHIASLDALQSYFNDYMQAYFHSKGKTLMGWDEIVEGGINSEAAVMFWRPWARRSPYEATANGNKVVMTPDGPLYFDAWPDRNTLESVYRYNPLDTMYGMSEEQQKNILGVQANLWTERVPTGDRADYLVMPRMGALAELGWAHKDRYADYLERLDASYDRLDRLHVHYRLPDLPEMADRRVFIDTAHFMVTMPGRWTVRYTTDGTIPGPASPRLTHPLTIDHSLTLKVAVFAPDGRRGDVQEVGFDRQAYATPVTGGARPGLGCTRYKGEFNHTRDIGGTPDSALTTPGVGLPAGIELPAYGLQFRGFINVPETGIYSFFLTSDDGSQLRIAGRLVVDNDGMHPAREKSGQIALQKGAHTFALDYMDGGGGGSLRLTYSKEDGPVKPVPNEWFSY
ncbi:MAG TPA: family 20 glycosylhydrolase [Dinghuibacter sp.]|uniref:family 20 glycosylhydrolase n=1 Tax=Dinghuibacter sp. TaxID=2024697 RepID=UPI002C760DAE|nr:family 20 glycosylhydrolase [Dinghuibacter sp.]HTJ10480.1 family 20 glycosylhydrolase [Dinghuibacter sp.]